MDIMMLLEGGALTRVYGDFRKKLLETGDGLSMTEFAKTMFTNIQGTKKATKSARVKLVRDLCELFDQIDVNGDGALEWEEFTGFCVEAGMVASHLSEAVSPFKYVYNRAFRDNVSRCDFINHVSFCKQTQQALVCEGELPLVRVYTRNLRLLNTIDTAAKARTEKDRSALPLRAIIINKKNLIAVAMTDLTINLYSTSSDDLELVGQMPVFSYPQTLFWSDESDCLYCGAADGTIRVYDLDRKLLKQTLTKHDDVVTSFAIISRHNLLVSASLDSKILLWDLGGRHKPRGRLKGFEHGVRQVVYSSDHELLLGAGFEYSALAWDVNTNGLLMRLAGHRTTLVGVQLVPCRPQLAITADVDGVFKLWGIDVSCMGNAPCLSTFTAGPLSKFSPRSFVVCGPSCQLLAGGVKLHMFNANNTSKPEIPSVALYNEASQHFVTASGKSIREWSAATGKLVAEYNGISQSDITALCFDDRQRKFIIGNQSGQVQVFNGMNGALMKEGVSHTSEVTAVLYNVADKCIISTAWDKRVRVHDEGPGEEVPELRIVDNAHKSDIACAAFSFDASLVATACQSFTIRVWDFQQMMLEGQLNGHASEITCMEFLPGYPVLISLDSAGTINMWSVRGHYSPYCCLHTYTHKINRKTARRFSIASVARTGPAVAVADEPEAKEVAAANAFIEAGESRADMRATQARLLAAASGAGAGAGAGAGGGESKLTFITEAAEEVEADLSDSSSDEEPPDVLAALAATHNMRVVAFSAMCLMPKASPVSRVHSRLATAASRRTAAIEERMNLPTPSDSDDEAKSVTVPGPSHSAGPLAVDTGGAPSSPFSASLPRVTSRRAQSSALLKALTPMAKAPADSEGLAAGLAPGATPAARRGPVVDTPTTQTAAERRRADIASRVGTATATGWYMYTADDMGIISRWDLTKQIRALKLSSTPPERLPATQNSYDPYRRLQRDLLKTSKPSRRKKRRPFPVPNKLEVLFRWKAHSGTIKSLKHVMAPSCLVTASVDGTSRVWSDTGELLGQLDTPRSELAAVLHGRAEPVPWKFEVDQESFRRNRQERAVRVLQKVDTLIEEEKSQRKSLREERRRQRRQERSDRLAEAKLSQAQRDEKAAVAASKLRRDNVLVEATRGAAAASETVDMGQALDWNAEAVDLESDKDDSDEEIKMPRRTVELSDVTSKYASFTTEQQQQLGYRERRMRPIDTSLSPFLTKKLGDEARRRRLRRKQPRKKKKGRRPKLPPASPMRERPGSRPPLSPDERREVRERLVLPKVDPEAALLAHKQKLRTQLHSSYQRRASTQVRRVTAIDRINYIIRGELPPTSITDASRLRNRIGGGVGSWIVKQGKTTSQVDLLRYMPLRRRKGSAAFEIIVSGATEVDSDGGSYYSSRRPSEASTVTARGAGEGAGAERSGRSSPSATVETARSGESEEEENFVDLAGVQTLADYPLLGLRMKVPKRLMRSVSERVDEAMAAEDAALPNVRRARKMKTIIARPKEEASPESDQLWSAPTHFGIYSIAEILQLKTMFDMFDMDGSRFIDLDEFVNNSGWESMFHLKDNAFSMFHKMDKNGDGRVSFVELMSVTFPLASQEQLKNMSKMVNRIHGMQQKATRSGGLSTLQIVRIEKAFKGAVGQTGIIDAEEVRKLLLSHAVNLDKEVTSAALRVMETDGTPNMSLSELLSLLEGVSLTITDLKLGRTPTGAVASVAL